MSASLTLTLLGLGFVAFLAAGVFIVWCLTEDEPPFRSEPGLRWPQRVAAPDDDQDAAFTGEWPNR